MGQIAEDMISGSCCSLCGQYFKHPTKDKQLYEHGYPVVCKDCYKELSKKERKQYQEAIVETL